MGHAATHLAELWRNGLPDGLVIELRDLTNGAAAQRSAWRTADELTAMPDAPATAATPQFLTYSLAAMRDRAPVRNSTAQLLPCAWVDLDLIDKHDKASTTADAARAAAAPVVAKLAALPMPPSSVVFSGAGLHAYWRLDDPADDIALVRRVNEHLAGELGGDRAAVNPSRVLRLPGTYNGRLADPVLCEPWPGYAHWRHEYYIEDLLDLRAGWAGAPALAPAALADPAAMALQAAGSGGPSDRDWAACEQQIRQGVNWHSNGLALVAHWVQRGVPDEQIHARAADWTLPGYTFDQTTREVQGFIETAVARWGRPGDQLPSSTDAPDAALTYELWRAERAVFDARNDRYIDTRTGEYMSHRSWETVNRHWHDTELTDKGDVKRLRWIDKYKDDPEKTIVRGTDVLPGEPIICRDEHGVARLNLWRPNPAIEWAAVGDPDSAAVAKFRQLVLFLCGDRLDVAEHLLHWIACSLFRDGERMRWAILLISEERGTGKSLLADTVRMLHYGPATASLETLGQLTGKFNGWLAGKSLVICQETLDVSQSAFTALESLKSSITEEQTMMELKGRDKQMVRAHHRFWFNSNSIGGLPFDANERRIYPIVCTAAKALPDDFYLQFAMFCKASQGLADIAAHLRSYAAEPLPLRAPETPDKALVQESLVPPFVELLNEHADKRPGAVAIRGQAMADIVRHLTGQSFRGGGQAEQLRRGGWRQEKTRISGTQARFWIRGTGVPDAVDDNLRGEIVDGGSLWG